MQERRTEVTNKIRAIISEQLGVDASGFEEDASFADDLGADSLAIVELMLAFEEHFKIEIPETETERMHTVAQLVSYIEQHTA